MITSDNLRSVKFLDGKNQLNWKSRSTSSSLNKILRRPGLAHVTHGHTILRAQIHARHIEDVHRLIWMFLVMPLEGLPEASPAPSGACFPSASSGICDRRVSAVHATALGSSYDRFSFSRIRC